MADVDPSSPPLLRLPDELLEVIVACLPPTATVRFGLTCKRGNRITYEPLVWRRHCIETWKHWDSRHEFDERLGLPPAQTKWQRLFKERKQIDQDVERLFDEMLLTQQHRIHRLEDIAKHGYDVKDIMRSLKESTPDDAEDVLARRYYANIVLGQIHRATALEKWTRLHKRQMVKLEEVLGAYDLFVLSGDKGDLDDIAKELDRIALRIKEQRSGFEYLTIREKAVQVAEHLRFEGLVGNPSDEDYHALRNNFISIALFDELHTSLPLQSVAIYCAVARRLGINAKPSNYPSHVHAVVTAPSDMTLDGKQKTPIQGAEPEFMHMDPWRSSEEVPIENLQRRLNDMGIPASQRAQHLGATSNVEIALRTGRNIMNSVHRTRERQRNAALPPSIGYPDVEAAVYSMVWSMVVLGDSNQATSLTRRRQCLPYLIEHYQAHFPEDLGLVESILLPMFASQREHEQLVTYIAEARMADNTRKAPSSRNEYTKHVQYKVGQAFVHRRYGYEGFIIGWDNRCSAEQQWITRMRVDDLPGGREQPFYNVVASDKSVRYVAEENISTMRGRPNDVLMHVAGKYFKRWDYENGAFVSNIKDEYPDD